jgi:hypothetical protein
MSRASSASELLQSLANIMRELRALVLRLRKHDVFREVSFQAVPGADPQNVTSFSFFVDAELQRVSLRAQASLGLSIDISIAEDGKCSASSSISWQFADSAGKGYAVDWDSLECQASESMDALEFVRGLPSYSRVAIERYEAALISYAKEAALPLPRE